MGTDEQLWEHHASGPASSSAWRAQAGPVAKGPLGAWPPETRAPGPGPRAGTRPALRALQPIASWDPLSNRAEFKEYDPRAAQRLAPGCGGGGLSSRRWVAGPGRAGPGRAGLSPLWPWGQRGGHCGPEARSDDLPPPRGAEPRSFLRPLPPCQVRAVKKRGLGGRMGHAQMTQAGAEGEDGDPPTPTPPRGAARLFKVSAAHMCYLGGQGWAIKPKTEPRPLVSSQGYTLWLLHPRRTAGALHSRPAFGRWPGTRL